MNDSEQRLIMELMHIFPFLGRGGYEIRSIPVKAGDVALTSMLISIHSKSDPEIMDFMKISFPGITRADITRQRLLIQEYIEADTENGRDKAMQSLIDYYDALRRKGRD